MPWPFFDFPRLIPDLRFALCCFFLNFEYAFCCAFQFVCNLDKKQKTAPPPLVSKPFENFTSS